MTSSDHLDRRATDGPGARAAFAAKPIILILGPTASGKTGLAIDLALRLPCGGECISADSMQVYWGMNIGTAKATPAEQAAVPHHLLDIADPRNDSFSVDAWLGLAEDVIHQARGRGRCPIIVGGTNLYVMAFLHGLMEGPGPNAALRAELDGLDTSALRERLLAVDPAAAQRIHANDRKRTIRALEVNAQTGRSLEKLHTQWQGAASTAESSTASIRHDVLVVGLDYPVEAINQRINARVKQMIESGLVHEVRQLRAAGALGRNAREALGYKQILAHLDGRCSLDEAIEQIKIRTRRLAKQQRTWLRRFRYGPYAPQSIWLNADQMDAQQRAGAALAWIAQRLSGIPQA